MEEIQAAGGRALAVRTDITVDEDVERMAQICLQEFGRIDILVSDAAANYNAMVNDLTVKKWDVMMRVNLRGTFVYQGSAACGVATDGFKEIFKRRDLSEDVLKNMATPEQVAEAALWIVQQPPSAKNRIQLS